MSHASLIVALSPQEIEKYGGVDNAVAFQMEPFKEDIEYFQDGSRWDWYVIGGRYTGKFRPDYDASEDPDNLQTCFICNGSGMRNDELGRRERASNPAYTCNGCDGKGQQLKHPGYFKAVGNVCLRKDLDESMLAKAYEDKAVRTWEEWQKYRHEKGWRGERNYWGIKEDETLDQLKTRCSSLIMHAYAFLKDRRWCENERLGWFGASAKTECEIANPDYKGRCITTCEKTGAKIVTWGETEERWDAMYWPRFLRNLSEDTTLVSVDYHI